MNRKFLARTILLMSLLTCFEKAIIAQQNNEQAGKSNYKISSTNRVFNDDTSKLQFAIITDLWGGRRPGIFEDAVSKLQLLQPQFVISVGDLIDGKTYDPKDINKQWDEFDHDIKPLTMPFFYVPGNHDIGNAIMETEWKKRLGSPYYHFVYKNVLFLSVNTEDGGKGGIHDEQVAYFKKALEENANVRWTFLFMHRPVWQGKGDKQEGYEKIEALLKGRNYSLFSGHHHTYLSVTKNGHKHYVLGSTGGGSDLRGEKFGEFDHVTMVTLTNGEPKVVNLKLDGIIKEDVVNEKTHPITETLIDQNWLLPIPFVSDHQQEKKVDAELIFNNPTNYPLKITGNLNKHITAYRIEPASVDMVIAPQKKIAQPITISKKDGSLIDLALLPSVDIELTGEYEYNKTKYSIPAEKKLLLSWKLIPAQLSKEKNVNANLYHNIDTSGMIYLTSPEQLNGPWYWSGATDGLLRFKVVQDKDYVRIIGLAIDDQWTNEANNVKDIIYLHLEDANGGQNVISCSPWDATCSIEGEGKISLKDITTKKFFTDNLFLIEFSIPVNKLLKADHTLRMNIGFRDYDKTPEKWVSTLFWKPLWSSESSYKNSGTFILK